MNNKIFEEFLGKIGRAEFKLKNGGIINTVEKSDYDVILDGEKIGFYSEAEGAGVNYQAFVGRIPSPIKGMDYYSSGGNCNTLQLICVKGERIDKCKLIEF